ncbi:dUTPase [Vaccinia virus Ankara]|uniref:Deoxyuridine 5'-triphosphate nucleotidohydrolase n=5 Tax=Vaccinia virus TaxID=10245 RepID=V5QZ93_VACCV|nr:Chain A, Deoxyuridine 5'-triphosphate nucleotidohydrolase [Vaccinia virus]2OKD_B Chain B, Deoxyuridine 5'-triphosphate nucleotidohydrolase [Vaccinia virus]2OKD_C Chain C, Deoxyuridine 5'-triphosphate nucleotidohydrolase [Vaccinia virus]2OKE_A Chain A, Deoxyuridine 5'-triphosphate nucleotidohydrolase [Vaccinia virus]2OKE_B Chain B, Deoxyuridine 5'-triphosphate nucleotidohydrolase [Vaccinia virus]2OKE_C Chain C, Deoxyuridine 5'-triphosphate nucleotidohydrolase [Vaccinia virus]2OL0_A Chain A,
MFNMNINSPVRFVKETNRAKSPTRQSPGAAGYDLYSAYDYTIPPGERQLIKTDISMSMPKFCYGRIAPRSGLSLKGIDIGGGVIDEDYRGNIGVILINNGKCTFNVNTGDRIAQLIYQRIYYPELEEVQSLDSTNRGDQGFGSTGLR